MDEKVKISLNLRKMVGDEEEEEDAEDVLCSSSVIKFSSSN